MTALHAPERPIGRSGVLFLLLLLSFTACEEIGLGSGATIALDSAEVSIPGRVHDVRLGRDPEAGAAALDSVRARPGDAVQFIALDRHPHAPTFVAAELDPDVRAFLERTGQLRGPPLVSKDARWVVLLEGAPAGRYPFTCRTHDVAGVLVVEPAGG